MEMIVGNQLYVPKPRQLIGYCYRFGFRSLDYGTAIAPGAFTQDVIDDYLKNPVLTSSVEDLPVGKVTHLAVDETGVWFTADVSDPGTVALMRRKVRKLPRSQGCCERRVPTG
jgi:phage head maturation protease